jgi:hypothetical protein
MLVLMGIRDGRRWSTEEILPDLVLPDGVDINLTSGPRSRRANAPQQSRPSVAMRFAAISWPDWAGATV